MSPVATVLLHSVRYSHGRSLHTYEDTIAAARLLWPTFDEHDRRCWLDLVADQVPRDLRRMIDAHGGSVVPVTRAELERELAAYEALVEWCRARLGPVAEWPCESCGHHREAMARGEGCLCRCHPAAWPGVATMARNLAPSAEWTWETDGAANVHLPDGEAFLAVETAGDVVICVGGAKWRQWAGHPMLRDDAETWLWARASSSMRRAAWARELLVALGWDQRGGPDE